MDSGGGLGDTHHLALAPNSRGTRNKHPEKLTPRSGVEFSIALDSSSPTLARLLYLSATAATNCEINRIRNHRRRQLSAHTTALSPFPSELQQDAKESKQKPFLVLSSFSLHGPAHALALSEIKTGIFATGTLSRSPHKSLIGPPAQAAPSQHQKGVETGLYAIIKL